jgi:tetratricopeptide (TPR) repeat protein
MGATSVQSASRWARLHFHLAESLETWGWRAGACWAYSDAVAADPTFAEAHFRMGEILVKLKRWTEARRALQQAIRLQPYHMEAHGNLVVSLYRQSALREATQILERMTRLRPFSAELHLVRGAILRRRRMHGESIRAFRWAVTLDLGAQSTRFNLGRELFGASEWEALVASYRGARDFDSLPIQRKRHADGLCASKRAIRVGEMKAVAHGISMSPSPSRRSRSPLTLVVALFHVIDGKLRVFLGQPHDAIRAFRQAHDALYDKRKSGEL